MPPSRKAAGANSKLDPHRAFLERRVAEKTDITMTELAGELAGMGLRIDQASLSRWYRRNDYRYKKSLLASEQDRPDVAAARREMGDGTANRGCVLRRTVWFLSTKLARPRRWYAPVDAAPKSQRLKGQAPFGHWKTQTFIAGLRRGALTAPLSSISQ